MSYHGVNLYGDSKLGSSRTLGGRSIRSLDPKYSSLLHHRDGHSLSPERATTSCGHEFKVTGCLPQRPQSTERPLRLQRYKNPLKKRLSTGLFVNLLCRLRRHRTNRSRYRLSRLLNDP